MTRPAVRSADSEAAASSPLPSLPHCRGTDHIAYPAGQGKEIVSSLIEARAAVVRAGTGALLARCRGFRSIEAHAELVCRAAGLPAERSAAVRRRLEELAEQGWMTSYDDLLRRCLATGAPPAALAPIAVMGVPTCDRPETLARGLRTYLQNSLDHGRDVELVLIDDSRLAASRAANLATVQALQQEYGARLSYAAGAEREAYAAALADESGVPRETVWFALLNPDEHRVSVGASRNTLLLHGVGERLVQLDDDTVCQVAPAPGARPGVAVGAAPGGLEHFFFETHEQACASVSFVPADYLGLYESVLARPVAEVLAEASTTPEPIDLDALSATFARRLARETCRVAVATLGVVGGSGMDAADMYFFATHPRSRERLFRFRGGHRRAFDSHHVVRAAARVTIAEHGLCQGLGLGLDNRSLLPPFMPVLRNEDGIFAHVRRACFPSTAVALLPWVVEHRAVERGSRSFAQLLRDAGRARCPDFLSWFVKAFAPGAAGEAPEDRLSALGRHLVEIGSRPRADYADRCRQILQKRLDAMTECVDVLASPPDDAPAEWRDDLARYLAAARENLRAEDGIAPRDLEAAGGADAVARGQDLVRRYGELLCAWPALVEAARELRRREQRPARAVGTRVSAAR